MVITAALYCFYFLGHRHEDISGTDSYLSMCYKYVDIFLSTTAPLLSRIENASYVANFLRIWRSWVVSSKAHKLSESFISRETYIDILISCHFSVLLILLTRDFSPDQPVNFAKSGSDVCEDFFSANGSFIVNKHTYSFLDMIRNSKRMSRLSEITSHGGLVMNKRHKKQESIWTAGQESNTEVDAAILKQYPSNDQVVVSWDNGLKMAQKDMCRLLGEFEYSVPTQL